jgi:hypothetical protein
MAEHLSNILPRLMRTPIHYVNRLLQNPIHLGIAVSTAISIVVNVLGFWDVEDMLTYFYSTGASYGGVLRTDSASQELVFRVLGVPVLDFGIIGGYRLPYQGAINMGPLWGLSTVFSAQLVIFMTHLLAMMVSGAAFGHFWNQIQHATSLISRRSRLMFVILLTAINYPTLEYVLDQDWYSNSVAYQGFLALTSALLSLMTLLKENKSTPPALHQSLRFAIVGASFLLMGLWSYLPLYVPPLLVLACSALVIAYRRKIVRVVLSRFLRSPLNSALTISLLMMLVSVVVEVVSEFSGRRMIDASGVDYWWAQPNRSISDLQHFLKQVFATETQPWGVLLDSVLGRRFGIPNDLTRIPHSGLVVWAFIAIQAFRGCLGRHRSTVVTLLVFWAVCFLQMIHLLPNPLRIRSDSFFRDILLSFALFATCLVLAEQRKHSPGSIGWKGDSFLPLIVALTSFALSIAYPIQHLSRWGGLSPYGLVGVVSRSDRWDEELQDALEGDSGVLAVVDPVFLNRWTEFLDRRNSLKLDGHDYRALRPEEWKGLYGSFQLRQAGFTLLEGQPKIRDATAFTGMNDSLKQSLEAPTTRSCDVGLLRFLNVGHVLATPTTMRRCASELATSQMVGSISPMSSEITDLSDSGLSMIRLQPRLVFESKSNPNAGANTETCGLLTDLTCFRSLRLSPTAEWRYNSDCSLPCIRHLSRMNSDSRAGTTLVMPINFAIGLSVTDDGGKRIPTTSVNGLLAIATDGVNGDHIFIEANADVRMWLMVSTAYAQYVVVGLATVLLHRKLRSERKPREMGRSQ